MVIRSLILCALLASASAAAVPLDQPFTLAYGQETDVGDVGVRLGFPGPVDESRCPYGVLCFWEGDAGVHLWIERPGAPREEFVLHTYRVWDQFLDFGAWRVTLLQVEPYPVFGEPIDPEAYVATFEVTAIDPVPAALTSWSALKSRYR